MEAIFARHFKASLARFEATVAAARGAPPDLSEASEPAQQSHDSCVVCLEPIRSSGKQDLGQLLAAPSEANVADTWVQLVNCRHCFHTDCIADAVRASLKADRRLRHAACPVCRASVVFDFQAGKSLAGFMPSET